MSALFSPEKFHKEEKITPCTQEFTKAIEWLEEANIPTNELAKYRAALTLITSVTTENNIIKLPYEFDSTNSNSLDRYLSVLSIVVTIDSLVPENSAYTLEQYIIDIILDAFSLNTKDNPNRSETVKQITKEQKQIHIKKYAAETLTWLILLVDNYPMLLQTLPSSITINLNADGSLHVNASETSLADLKTFTDTCTTAVFNLFEKDHVVKLPFRDHAYNLLLPTVYQALEVPKSVWQGANAHYFPNRDVIVIYSNTDGVTQAHEHQHRDFPGFAITEHNGTGLDEALTDYKARRSTKKNRVLNSMKYTLQEEALYSLYHDLKDNELHHVFLFLTLMFPAAFIFWINEIAKANGKKAPIDDSISLHDNLILKLKKIFVFFPHLKPLLLKKYESKDSQVTHNYWQTMIIDLGVEVIGALYAWSYGPTDASFALNNKTLDYLIDKRLKELRTLIA